MEIGKVKLDGKWCPLHWRIKVHIEMFMHIRLVNIHSVAREQSLERVVTEIESPKRTNA